MHAFDVLHFGFAILRYNLYLGLLPRHVHLHSTVTLGVVMIHQFDCAFASLLMLYFIIAYCLGCRWSQEDGILQEQLCQSCTAILWTLRAHASSQEEGE